MGWASSNGAYGEPSPSWSSSTHAATTCVRLDRRGCLVRVFGSSSSRDSKGRGHRYQKIQLNIAQHKHHQLSSEACHNWACCSLRLTFIRSRMLCSGPCKLAGKRCLSDSKLHACTCIFEQHWAPAMHEHVKPAVQRKREKNFCCSGAIMINKREAKNFKPAVLPKAARSVISWIEMTRPMLTMHRMVENTKMSLNSARISSWVSVWMLCLPVSAAKANQRSSPLPIKPITR
mmetsp:Transcript_81476/g.154685  ORF Transcript_81476/g.154685 Transcript_81476/m.154685 type:complete len:232 (+) Transcript_81476:397-1092(+)